MFRAGEMAQPKGQAHNQKEDVLFPESRFLSFNIFYGRINYQKNGNIEFQNVLTLLQLTFP